MKRSEAEALIRSYTRARDAAQKAAIRTMQPSATAADFAAVSLAAEDAIRASHVAREALIKALTGES